MSLKVIAGRSLPPQRVVDLSDAKLKSSGLSPEDGVTLGMYPVNCKDLDPAFKDVGGLQIVYRDLDGADTGFYRVRYLETPSGFAAQTAKPQRYAQSAGTLNWVYLPHLNLPWADIANDATIPLIITEGELKAACAAKHGFPTIALGGVTVWQSRKKGVPLLPPLDKFNWKGRKVTVVFDSDALTNPDVARAQVNLAQELVRLGAVSSVASLPPSIAGGKQGLDDFLVAEGDLDLVLQEGRATELGERLLAFNETYAYVISQDVILKLSDGSRMKRDAFINGVCNHIKVVEYLPTASGNLKRVETLVPREWLGWTARRDVNTLVYAPGEGMFTDSGDYNLWRGWGCEPRAGDVSKWHEFLDYVFMESPSDRQWFEQWLAYPLQRPGFKLYSGCLFWGPETGTGKTLIGETMGRIYGANFTPIDYADLVGQYNGWATNKQLIMGDEISGSDKRHEADKLKNMITRTIARIDDKYVPKFSVKDCNNYYLTSNHPDSLFIEDKDRRWFIHRMPRETRPRKFYVDFLGWLDEQQGACALFHYLLNLDLSGFDPKGPARSTQAKLEMIHHSKSDIASFVSSFLRNVDDELARLKNALHLPENPDIVLNKHILMLYDPDGNSRVTAGGLGKVLSSAGITTVEVQRTAAFGSQRFYVLRNTERWLNAKPDALRQYIDSIYSPAKKGKF